MTNEDKNLELSEEDLKHVSGGYKGFDDRDLESGVCVKSFNLIKQQNVITYYLVLGVNTMCGYCMCKKWVTVNDTIMINGVKCNADFSEGGANIIYCIEENPPAFVHN